MENIQNKLMKFIDSLSMRNKLLLIIALLIILVIFYVIFIDGNYRGNDINYKKSDISTIIDSSTLIYDRDQILALDEVIDRILRIENESWAVDTKFVTLSNLYSQVLTDNYKKNISKRNFRNKMNIIYSNVLGENHYNEAKNYTKQVYYSTKFNMYLVELNTLNDTRAFIGIRLVNNTYVITYVE